MPSKEEKDKRKQILKDIKQKASNKFERGLPVSRGVFKKLFDFLDVELGNEGCDDTLKMTKLFLNQNGITNIAEVENWLKDKGGYCDCEVLANIEEYFE